MKDEAGSHFDPDVVDAFLKCLPQIIEMNRGGHFPYEYIDEMSRHLTIEGQPLNISRHTPYKVVNFARAV